MLIIKIEANADGGRINQTDGVSTVPSGFAVIPPDMNTPNFPYGTITTAKVNGVMTVTSWTASIVPIEKLRENKLNSLNGMCSGAIYAGLDINGKHYNFTALAQESIKGLMQEIQQGPTIVPYKADGEGYTPHTAEQMTTIAKTMSEWIKVNTHYYDLLKQWVERETDETIIDSIHYGSVLPNDLMQTLVLQLAQYGIDITKYASMLGG